MKKDKEENEDRRMVFLGPGDKFVAHGLEMEKGVVYPVSNDVFEYLRYNRNVQEIKGIKLSKLDFSKIKKVI